MKNHGNMVSQKENESSPETKLCLRTMRFDRLFKWTVRQKLNQLQEKEFSELRNKMIKQKEYFMKAMEIQKESNKFWSWSVQQIR